MNIDGLTYDVQNDKNVGAYLDEIERMLEEQYPHLRGTVWVEKGGGGHLGSAVLLKCVMRFEGQRFYATRHVELMQWEQAYSRSALLRVQIERCMHDVMDLFIGRLEEPHVHFRAQGGTRDYDEQ